VEYHSQIEVVDSNGQCTKLVRHGVNLVLLDDVHYCADMSMWLNSIIYWLYIRSYGYFVPRYISLHSSIHMQYASFYASFLHASPSASIFSIFNLGRYYGA
jgi:hypothetical protein